MQKQDKVIAGHRKWPSRDIETIWVTEQNPFSSSNGNAVIVIDIIRNFPNDLSHI